MQRDADVTAIRHIASTRTRLTSRDFGRSETSNAPTDIGERRRVDRDGRSCDSNHAAAGENPIRHADSNFARGVPSERVNRGKYPVHYLAPGSLRGVSRTPHSRFASARCTVIIASGRVVRYLTAGNYKALRSRRDRVVACSCGSGINMPESACTPRRVLADERGNGFVTGGNRRPRQLVEERPANFRERVRRRKKLRYVGEKSRLRCSIIRRK